MKQILQLVYQISLLNHQISADCRISAPDLSKKLPEKHPPFHQLRRLFKNAPFIQGYLFKQTYNYFKLNLFIYSFCGIGAFTSF